MLRGNPCGKMALCRLRLNRSRLALRLHSRETGRKSITTAAPNGVDTNEPREVLLYTSLFGNKIRWLRRISLSSTFLSLGLMPVSMIIQSGLLPVPAQVALASTVFFSSFSSTILLQVVAHPYVHTLHEIIRETSKQSESTPESEEDKNTRMLNRQFRATTVGVFGNLKSTVFSLKDTGRDVSNPFASFRIRSTGTASNNSKGSDASFYLYGGTLEDSVLRKALTKE